MKAEIENQRRKAQEQLNNTPITKILKNNPL